MSTVFSNEKDVCRIGFNGDKEAETQWLNSLKKWGSGGKYILVFGATWL